MDYIDVHTHSKSASGLSIINVLPTDEIAALTDTIFSIGLHPWFIEPENYLKNIFVISEMAKSRRCMAIGETGLDKLSKTDFNLQKSAFIRQIELAEELKKPMIIHCVKAFDELVALKRETGSTVTWIIHGFNSKIGIAERLLNEKMVLSFGKHLKYDNANAALVLRETGYNNFFLETDGGNLTIQEVYESAAKIMGLPTEDLKTIICNNFNQTFQYQYG